MGSASRDTKARLGKPKDTASAAHARMNRPSDTSGAGRASGTPDQPARAGSTFGTPGEAAAPPEPLSILETSVTFIIPCFNHGKFVADAVRSCLAQEKTDARVVVIDDGSNDGTTPKACDRCEKLPGWVEVIHQRNKGLPAARNVGAARAAVHESEFLVFLDADDTIEPTFVRKLRAAIESAWSSDPASRGLGQGAISHAYCQERLTDKAFGTWAVPAWDPVLLLITNLHPVTALVRRECFESAARQMNAKSGSTSTLPGSPAASPASSAPASTFARRGALDLGFDPFTRVMESDAAQPGATAGFDESMTKGYEDWDLWLRFASRGWRGVRVREPLFNWRRHAEVTMVMEAVRHHDELFRQLMTKHKAMYERHATELIARSNLLLRKADANWLDENLEAIYVRDLRARNIELFGEVEAAKQEAARLRGEIDEIRAAAQREAARLASDYENKPALRWSRRLHAMIDAMPRPLAEGVRRVLRGLKGQ